MTIAAKNQFYTADDIGGGVIAISATAGELAYLVKGEKKALLIDTSTGIGSIKAFIQPLLGGLPFDVVITHGHIDHAGNAYEFDKVYIHPEDIAMVQAESFAEGRLSFARGQWESSGRTVDYTDGDIVSPRSIAFVPVQEGDSFDLGGRTLTVVALPGHSKGSICLFDEASGDFFAGDACNGNTLLMLETSACIDEYHRALLRVEKLLPKINRYFCFHGGYPTDKTILTDNRELCEEIMAGTDDGVPSSFLGREALLGKKRDGHFRREDGRIGNIMYRKDRIFHKETN